MRQNLNFMVIEYVQYFSICSLDSCVRNFKKETSCSTTEAIEAATLHPAQLLGIQDVKGTLDHGSDADFILLDDMLNVQATFIAGKPVYVDNRFMENELNNKLA